jgi:hypothetical protein
MAGVEQPKVYQYDSILLYSAMGVTFSVLTQWLSGTLVRIGGIDSFYGLVIVEVWRVLWLFMMYILCCVLWT